MFGQEGMNQIRRMDGCVAMMLQSIFRSPQIRSLLSPSITKAAKDLQEVFLMFEFVVRTCNASAQRELKKKKRLTRR